MLMYLYGPDAYRRSQKVKEIIGAYEKKHSGLTRQVFHMGAKDSLDRVRAFLESQSLFDTTKLGLFYEADETPELAKLLKTFIEDKKTTLIVVSEKKLPKEFAFLLKKPVLTQLFDALEATELYAFIKTEAKNRDIELTSDMLRYVSDVFGSDTWGIVTELEKLALGGKAETPVRTPDFFPLIQALKRRGDVRARLIALGLLLESEDPAAIFNVTASIADPELKIKMADLDIAVKSGKLEYEEALLELALS